MSDERGTLADREPHPAAYAARRWLADHAAVLPNYVEAFASTAIEGNRMGEVCGETLRRLLAGEMVSDRYILGLAWAVRNMEEDER